MIRYFAIIAVIFIAPISAHATAIVSYNANNVNASGLGFRDNGPAFACDELGSLGCKVTFTESSRTVIDFDIGNANAEAKVDISKGTLFGITGANSTAWSTEVSVQTNASPNGGLAFASATASFELLFENIGNDAFDLLFLDFLWSPQSSVSPSSGFASVANKSRERATIFSSVTITAPASASLSQSIECRIGFGTDLADGFGIGLEGRSCGNGGGFPDSSTINAGTLLNPGDKYKVSWTQTVRASSISVSEPPAAIVLLFGLAAVGIGVRYRTHQRRSK